MLTTAAQILAAAPSFNEVTPDANWTDEDVQNAVDHGRPFIRVMANRGNRNRGGIKCLIYACIDDPNGDGAWACEEPTVKWLKDTDGRLSAAKIASRASRYLGTHDAEVPVRYTNPHGGEHIVDPRTV